MSAIINFENLTKTYKDFWGRKKVTALKELNLEIEEGQIFGLLGPNGSGKTTALKLLLGLLFPTSGKIKVFDKPPRDVRIKKNIGFLPEESYLYPFLSGEELLDFSCRLINIKGKERKKRVDDVLKTVGLSGVGKRPVKDYSKGMARRVNFAQVLVKDPKLVILDEPTIGLDPFGAMEMKDVILDLKRQGKTILLSSHLLTEIQPLCDRVGILYDGELIKTGKVDELLSISDELEIITKGLDEKGRAEVTEVIRKRQAELVSIGHPKESLESLFMKTIDKSRRVKK